MAADTKTLGLLLLDYVSEQGHDPDDVLSHAQNLVHAGADVTATEDGCEISSLDWALSNGYDDTAQFLLDSLDTQNLVGKANDEATIKVLSRARRFMEKDSDIYEQCVKQMIRLGTVNPDQVTHNKWAMDPRRTYPHF